MTIHAIFRASDYTEIFNSTYECDTIKEAIDEVAMDVKGFHKSILSQLHNITLYAPNLLTTDEPLLDPSTITLYYPDDVDYDILNKKDFIQQIIDELRTDNDVAFYRSFEIEWIPRNECADEEYVLRYIPELSSCNNVYTTKDTNKYFWELKTYDVNTKYNYFLAGGVYVAVLD